MESALNIIIISGIVYHDDTTVIISKHSNIIILFS